MNRIALKAEARSKCAGRYTSLMMPMIFLFCVEVLVALINGLINRYVPSLGGIMDFIVALGTCLLAYLTVVFYRRYTNYGAIASVKEYLTNIGSAQKAFKVLACNIIISCLTALGIIFFIVPGIIIAIMYSQADYILSDDDNVSITEALRLSRMMMYGRKMEYFIFQLSFIGWYLLVGITFGIAMLWVGSYLAVSFSLYYEDLKSTYFANSEDRYATSPYCGKMDENTVEEDFFTANEQEGGDDVFEDGSNE